MKRVLVCGGRDDDAFAIINVVLTGLHRTRGPATLIHGDARGVDRQAASVAYGLGWDIEPHPWLKGHGRAGGHARNVEMIHANPGLVLAFKEQFDWTFAHGGTEHMVGLGRDHGVPTFVIQRVR